MNDEVYSTPQSNLDMEKNIDVPEDVLKKIRNAWVAGLISICCYICFYTNINIRNRHLRLGCFRIC
jgi:hypothetical protein